MQRHSSLLICSFLAAGSAAVVRVCIRGQRQPREATWNRGIFIFRLAIDLSPTSCRKTKIASFPRPPTRENVAACSSSVISDEKSGEKGEEEEGKRERRREKKRRFRFL